MSELMAASEEALELAELPLETDQEDFQLCPDIPEPTLNPEETPADINDREEVVDDEI
jgi:hypothetical protein